MSKRTASTLVIVIAVAFLTLAIAGCAGAKSESTSTQQAEGSDAQSVAYLPTRKIQFNSDGSIYADFKYEYDERGCLLRTTVSLEDSFVASLYGATTHESSDYNEQGYLEREQYGDSVYTFEFEYAGDRAIRVTASSGDTTLLEYHDNGIMKSRTGIDADGNVNLEQEFDEDGYLIKQRYRNNDGSYGESAITWEKDSNGMAIRFTSSDFSDMRRSYTIENDEHGNFVKLYDSAGRLYEEFEYKAFPNACPASWVNSHIREIL